MSADWVADHLGQRSYGVGSEEGAASDWLWGAISAVTEFELLRLVLSSSTLLLFGSGERFPGPASSS
eukprot:1339702-Rhodomonas_salina.1